MNQGPYVSGKVWKKGPFLEKSVKKSGEMEKVRENHIFFPRIITIPDMEIMFFLFVLGIALKI